jgi:hypothetical protein
MMKRRDDRLRRFRNRSDLTSIKDGTAPMRHNAGQAGAAEFVAKPIAQKCGGELVIYH